VAVAIDHTGERQRKIVEILFVVFRSVSFIYYGTGSPYKTRLGNLVV
jgi:hypothetical protein